MSSEPQVRQLILILNTLIEKPRSSRENGGRLGANERLDNHTGIPGEIDFHTYFVASQICFIRDYAPTYLSTSLMLLVGELWLGMITVTTRSDGHASPPMSLSRIMSRFIFITASCTLLCEYNINRKSHDDIFVLICYKGTLFDDQTERCLWGYDHRFV